MRKKDIRGERRCHSAPLPVQREFDFDSPPLAAGQQPKSAPPKNASLESSPPERATKASPQESDPFEELVRLAKTRHALKDRETRVLKALLALGASIDPNTIVWQGSEKKLAKAASDCGRNTASRGVDGLENKGLVTSRKRPQGGSEKQYRVRLDVLCGEESPFGTRQQLSLESGRAQAATVGAPSKAGGRAQAAWVGAPNSDPSSEQGDFGGRAHPHEMIELNESKTHSLNSTQPGRAQQPTGWTWTPDQLADPTCVDHEIAPAAIQRFSLMDSRQVREGIAAAACCACSKGVNAPGLFTRLVESRAWERQRSKRPGQNWIAERWFDEARELRSAREPQIVSANPAVQTLAEVFTRQQLDAELDGLADDQIAQLAARALRSYPAAQHAWQHLQTMSERRNHTLIRPLLIRQLESDREQYSSAGGRR